MIETICGIAVVLILLYYYIASNYDFWKKRGVKGPEPKFFYGNTKDVLFTKQAFSQYLVALYKEYKNEPMIGIFNLTQPSLVINDLDIIKTVMIKDFTKFSDRGFHFNETAEPLSLHLFALETKRWRPLRTRLSPVFTSSKLKEMFSLMVDCANNLENHLEKLSETENVVNFRELAAEYTTDVIGSCAFGINMNAMSDKDSEFRVMGRKFFEPRIDRIIRFRLREITPRLYAFLSYFIPYPFGTKFFTDSVTNVMKYRKENNVARNDFIDILIDLQEHPEKLKDIELTKELLTAQAFVFFVAGFETSSTTISNALYELALHQDIQDKLREEIREYDELNKGVWHYENVKAMPILDGVFKEVLRLYPAVAHIQRKSVADYTFEETNVSIPSGLPIFIPVYGIHHDPEIYPNPDVFDITRFTAEEEAKRHQMAYMPFGHGPRNCIGARFAIFQTKIGMIKILRNFKIETCSETVIPYRISPKTFLLAPDHEIKLKFTKIK